MHDLTGYSQLYDRVRKVLLASLVELQISEDEAIVLVSSMHGGKSEAMIYDHPLVVDALDRLCSALEEAGSESGGDKPIGQRATWMICPTCKKRGWEESNYGDWHVCPTCEGDGIIIVR